jgi:hypothetical protein
MMHFPQNTTDGYAQHHYITLMQSHLQDTLADFLQAAQNHCQPVQIQGTNKQTILTPQNAQHYKVTFYTLSTQTQQLPN